MANVKQQLEVPSTPSLGFAPEAYERRHFSENYGALNIYFRKLVSALGALFGPMGCKFLNNAHGSFFDTTDQTAANTTTAYAVKFNTTDFSNGVTIANNSQITVHVDGIWNAQFSLQFKNTTNDGQDIDIWFRLNGTNIANSNTRFHIQARKSTGDPSYVVASMNYFLEMVDGDYVEIMWRVSDVNVTMEYLAAMTTPDRPAVPSAIATMTFVSNLPT